MRITELHGDSRERTAGITPIRVFGANDGA
jgi:hypothetical protein